MYHVIQCPHCGSFQATAAQVLQCKYCGKSRVINAKKGVTVNCISCETAQQASEMVRQLNESRRKTEE